VSVDICGQRYRVMVDPAYDGKKWEGGCTWSDNLIEILEQAEDRMHDSLIHEIVHAITDACGLKWSIATRFKKLTAKERRELDEMLCRSFAPAILQTFRNAGWLRLPRWKRGSSK
jgi:Zn-dependent peptidase ImmA (M78 family)